MAERNPFGKEPTDIPRTRNLGETTPGSMTGSTEGAPTGGLAGGGSMAESRGGGLGMESGHEGKRLREAWRTGSPSDVKEATRDFVEKGVAAVAGALRGFSEAAQREKMAEQTKEAIHEAGRTATTATGEAQKQLSEVGGKAREFGQEAKNQYSTMKEQAKGQYSSMKEEAKHLKEGAKKEAKDLKHEAKDLKDSATGGEGGQGGKTGEAPPVAGAVIVERAEIDIEENKE